MFGIDWRQIPFLFNPLPLLSLTPSNFIHIFCSAYTVDALLCSPTCPLVCFISLPQKEKGMAAMQARELMAVHGLAADKFCLVYYK